MRPQQTASGCCLRVRLHPCTRTSGSHRRVSSSLGFQNRAIWRAVARDSAKHPNTAQDGPPRPEALRPRKSAVHGARSPALHESAHLILEQLRKATTTTPHGRPASQPGPRGAAESPRHAPRPGASPGCGGRAATGGHLLAVTSRNSHRKKVLSLRQVTSWAPPAPLGRAGQGSSGFRDGSLGPSRTTSAQNLPRDAGLMPSGRHNHSAISSPRPRLPDPGLHLPPRPCSLHPPPSRPLLPQDSQALGRQGHSRWALSPHTHLSPQPGLETEGPCLLERVRRQR